LRRTNHKFLDLSLRHTGTGPLRDQFNNFVERRLRTLLGHSATDFVRVLLDGQPQRGIERSNALYTNRLVDPAGYLHLPERCLHTPCARSRVRPRHTIRADHVHRLFEPAPHVDVRLEQLGEKAKIILMSGPEGWLLQAAAANSAAQNVGQEIGEQIDTEDE
jgi:hypothetical protein